MNVMTLMAVALAGWINRQQQDASGLAACLATTTGTRHETDDSGTFLHGVEKTEQQFRGLIALGLPDLISKGRSRQPTPPSSTEPNCGSVIRPSLHSRCLHTKIHDQKSAPRQASQLTEDQPIPL